MKKKMIFGTLTILLTSCVAEKPNVSPLNNFVKEAITTTENNKMNVFSISENIHAAEITKIISNLPKTNNKNLKIELETLRLTLQNYLYAIDAENFAGKERALKNLEKTYVKIQKIREKLPKDEDNILNRDLVRLKTNITLIEDSLNLTDKK